VIMFQRSRQYRWKRVPERFRDNHTPYACNPYSNNGHAGYYKLQQAVVDANSGEVEWEDIDICNEDD